MYRLWRVKLCHLSERFKVVSGDGGGEVVLNFNMDYIQFEECLEF